MRKKSQIEYLKDKLKQTEERIKILIEENRKLNQRIEEKEGEIKILKNIVFGKKSERRKEKVSVRKGKQGAVIGHKGTGRKIPEGLPIKEEIIEMPEKERFCPFCGSPYLLQKNLFQKVNSQ